MPLPDISLASWAGIMAAAALIGTCWRTIMAWGRQIVGLVICRVAVKDEVARAVMSYVWMRGKRSPFGIRVFGGITSYVFPKRRVEVIGYEAITNEPLLVWVGRAPILVGLTYGSGNNENAPNMGGYDGNNPPLTIRFLRGTLDSETFIEQAIQAYNAIRQQTLDTTKGPRRFNVIRMHGPCRDTNARMESSGTKSSAPVSVSEGPSEIVTRITRNELRLLTWKPDDLIERQSDLPPFDSHPIPPAMLAEFDEIYTWLAKERWFRSKGAAWYRGYLLYGPSGSGKSTIVRNLAMRHDFPVYTFDLSSYDNRSFTDDWRQVLQNAPAIALLEDIDCCFSLRENVAVKDKNRDGLTFDCLLNTLSGIGSSDGVLLFVTTNHIDALDPALGVPDNGFNRSTRPGRINRAIYVGPMATNERRLLASHILSDSPELIEPTVLSGEGEMAAQFQERCVQLAVRQFWRQREAHDK